MKHTWHTLQNGLKDFCAANGFDKVILGLSGGLDSALTAVLAADALGGKNVKAIMMKTRYTSDLSIKIAREIARLNGLDYQELDIEPLVTVETDFLQRAFGESVKGITAENLQARIRGQLLMAFSNQNGGLVLACGNKSEALTGLLLRTQRHLSVLCLDSGRLRSGSCQPERPVLKMHLCLLPQTAQHMHMPAFTKNLCVERSP